ncbi:hypothetical protein SAMD00019534_006850, partial [Acytostelium subglobosum LB1]|uniref:hypothetical protein n=1 Tax=Acytostelium subglobosum LB1 TaxID=1410327 RepID=UPI000644B4F3
MFLSIPTIILVHVASHLEALDVICMILSCRSLFKLRPIIAKFAPFLLPMPYSRPLLEAYTNLWCQESSLRVRELKRKRARALPFFLYPDRENGKGTADAEEAQYRYRLHEQRYCKKPTIGYIPPP